MYQGVVNDTIYAQLAELMGKYMYLRVLSLGEHEIEITCMLSTYMYNYEVSKYRPFRLLRSFLCHQIEAVNNNGSTSLHVACNNGQDVVVDILLQHKASINPRNNKGQTPLHFAAWSHHGALCMELLVKAGADPNIQVGVVRGVVWLNRVYVCGSAFV